MTARIFLRPFRKNCIFLGALLSAAILLPSLSAAQGITVRTTVAPVSVLSISDIDFANSLSTQWLFTVDMNAGGRTTDVTLTVDVNVTLSSGERFDQAVHIETDPFTVQGARTITNLDMGKGRTIHARSNFDPSAKSKFEDIALPSGQMPAGTYSFDVVVRESLIPVAKDNFSIVLTNPSSIDLLFPPDADQAVSTLPLFQWEFEGTRSRIAVFEQLPGQSSLEEAAGGVPHLVADVAGTSYQYPTAGVRPLQPGHTYVWYVEGHVNAIGGHHKILRSPLRSFTVDAGPSAVSSLLDELERALDPKYKPLFDQIREENLSISGSAKLNGETLSNSELMRLLQDLRNHPDSVQSAGLE